MAVELMLNLSQSDDILVTFEAWNSPPPSPFFWAQGFNLIKQYFLRLIDHPALEVKAIEYYLILRLLI
jgi:hypothetical protein